MFDLIPLPYRILGALLLALGLISVGFGYGVKITNDRHAAHQLTAERLAADQYRAEVVRGNDLSAKLSAAESNIQIKTVERIKYVPQVTTGKPCLSAGAVSLLNGTDKPTSREAAGKPVAEDAGASATDVDVETWALDASSRYETCAARLNGLIDWEVERP